MEIRKSGPGHKLVDDGVPLEPAAAPRQGFVTLDDFLEPSGCLCDFGLKLEGLVSRVWRLPRKGEQRRARVHHRTLGEETGAPHRVSRACKGLQQGVGEGTPPC